jgi:hypothetical protein
MQTTPWAESRRCHIRPNSLQKSGRSSRRVKCQRSQTYRLRSASDYGRTRKRSFLEQHHTTTRSRNTSPPRTKDDTFPLATLLTCTATLPTLPYTPMGSFFLLLLFPLSGIVDIRLWQEARSMENGVFGLRILISSLCTRYWTGLQLRTQHEHTPRERAMKFCCVSFSARRETFFT